MKIKQLKYWLAIAAIPTLYTAIMGGAWAQYPAETTEQLSKHVDRQKETQKPVQKKEASKPVATEEQSEIKEQIAAESQESATQPAVAAQSENTTPDSTATDKQDPLAQVDKREVSRDLEQQYLKLRESIETEDAFSEQLGEDYLGYGMLLRESGQYKEAIKAFVDALHIAKVNNGIYGIEQRPALEALFETHFLLENPADYEEAIQRLLWVEEKNPGSASEISFKMQLLLGNKYLDQFLGRPIRGQESVDKLLLARRHLSNAVRIHGNRPLNELMMPYGELALISFVESTILPNVNSRSTNLDPMFKSSRRLAPGGPALPIYFTDSYPRGMAYLKRYLKKAQEENNREHVVHALLGMGDYQQLFKKDRRSIPFYQQAWEQAQGLPEDHKLRLSFAEPVALPRFNYAYDRSVVLPQRETVEVPLTLKVSQYGKVQDVAEWDDAVERPQEYSRARRVVRRKVFRPRMVEGEPANTDAYEYKIRVYKKK